MAETALSSSAFASYTATAKLKQLAKKPYDLTQKEALSPERIEHFYSEGAGFKVFYGTERVTDEVMEALALLAKEAGAVEKMREMQSGAVINRIEGYPSDNRAVLHTAMRDLFEHPNSGKEAQEATRLEKIELKKLEAFLPKVKHFTDIVAVGIGGSNLGPEAVYTALKHFEQPGKHAHFISNIDPDQIEGVLKGLNLKTTLIVSVSKSGSTLETVTNEEYVRRYFKQTGLDPHKHFISITGQGSPMDDPSRYLECFYSWDFVGGRFSTSAMYGAVTLSFTLGLPTFMEFLRGCHAMDKLALLPDIHDNLPLLIALLGVWNRNFLHHPLLAVIAYSSALSRFPAHIQQVDMESNGKHIDKQGRQVDFATGPAIFGEPGTNAQHSFFQEIHQGTDVIPVEFIGFKKSQTGKDETIFGTTTQQKLISNMIAQSIGLAQGKTSDNPNKEFQGNRPSHIIFGEELNPFNMGSLFALVEHKVAFQGFIWGINSFDQEGVQLGKDLGNKMIALFAGKEKYPLGEAYLKHIL